MTLSHGHSSVDTDQVLSLPRSCWACQVLLPRTAKAPYFCQRCSVSICSLDPERFAGQEILALYPYQGVMARLLTQLKFQGKRSAARPLGELLHEGLANLHQSPSPSTHLVCVPLHWRRRVHRGFNQCELIVSWAGLKARCAPGLLRKTRASVPQHGLKRAERQRNLAQAFAVDPGAEIQRDAQILVMDDVTTTGATLAGALFTLRAAGYSNCKGLALMQAQRP